jgi:hypothetical protein
MSHGEVPQTILEIINCATHTESIESDPPLCFVRPSSSSSESLLLILLESSIVLDAVFTAVCIRHSTRARCSLSCMVDLLPNLSAKQFKCKMKY